jgi:hypothetical protein
MQIRIAIGAHGGDIARDQFGIHANIDELTVLFKEPFDMGSDLIQHNTRLEHATMQPGLADRAFHGIELPVKTVMIPKMVDDNRDVFHPCWEKWYISQPSKPQLLPLVKIQNHFVPSIGAVRYPA